MNVEEEKVQESQKLEEEQVERIFLIKHKGTLAY